MGLKKFGAEKITSRPLDFIWILDVSGSMHGEKIAALNYAIKEVLPSMKETAKKNLAQEIMVRVISFATEVNCSERIPLNNFEWQDLEANGLSNLGKAFTELADILDEKNMPERGLPPVLVLITDGLSTDDYKKGLDLVMSKPWGKKAVRLAISLDSDIEIEVLEDFIDNKNIKPIKAENSTQLIQYIKFVSTVVLSNVSSAKGYENLLLNFDFELPEEDDDTNNTEVYDVF